MDNFRADLTPSISWRAMKCANALISQPIVRKKHIVWRNYMAACEHDTILVSPFNLMMRPAILCSACALGASFHHTISERILC